MQTTEFLYKQITKVLDLKTAVKIALNYFGYSILMTLKNVSTAKQRVLYRMILTPNKSYKCQTVVLQAKCSKIVCCQEAHLIINDFFSASIL